MTRIQDADSLIIHFKQAIVSGFHPIKKLINFVGYSCILIIQKP